MTVAAPYGNDFYVGPADEIDANWGSGNTVAAIATLAGTGTPAQIDAECMVVKPAPWTELDSETKTFMRSN